MPAVLAGRVFGVITVGTLVPASVMSIAAATSFVRNVYVEYFHPTVTPSPYVEPQDGLRAPLLDDQSEPDREAAVAGLFDLHYPSMLRLATLLGADDPENIVAEAFYQIYRKWRKLRSADSATSYLRSVVCNLTRMQIRHLQVARKHAEATVDSVVSAESSALLREDQRALVSALRQLPPRQREALVLRHWLGLKEGEIADTMGISPGSVKTHTARGIAALTKAMEARR